VTPSVAASHRDTSVAAYEQLRSRVLAGSGCGSAFGLVLLRREGIAAWVARGSARSAPVALAVPDRDAAAHVGSDEIHAGVVRVLANMALAAREETNA
jgi:hypothetical protein